MITFEKGQTVECAVYGIGKIISIDNGVSMFSIVVLFQCGITHKYTNNGHFDMWSKVTLKIYEK